MTEPESPGPQRLRLLAGYLAGRAVDVAEAPAGQPAHTDGQVVFVSPRLGRAAAPRGAGPGGLLGAGSLDPALLRSLRGRGGTARRYLSVEGRRVLSWPTGSRWPPSVVPAAPRTVRRPQSHFRLPAAVRKSTIHRRGSASSSRCG
ncbi:hypothetical protein MCHIJ_00020 [Mycolicibacterium chitae]|nr:hypothetical protein [Mycolicibacterium chitae]BBZ00565.1 hypothetical protein MCHIJ_00020 [Mycolicibacterium chitae]